MKEYNKLVRDLIPQFIEESGKTPVYETLSQASYCAALGKKLIEEANEFHSSPCMEELADLLEVIEALIHCYGYDLDVLLRIKNEKKAQRGGFDKHVFLKHVL